MVSDALAVLELDVAVAEAFDLDALEGNELVVFCDYRAGAMNVCPGHLSFSRFKGFLFGAPSLAILSEGEDRCSVTLDIGKGTGEVNG
jgi:hypothetical protein